MSSVIKVYNERQQTISVKNDTPPPTLQETVIESNGVFMPEDGYVGFGEVTVNVPPYGEGEVEITSNGTHNVSGKAVANVNVPMPLLQEKTALGNGVYTADEGYYGLSKVTVNVPSADSLIEGNLTEVTSNATKVREYAFQYWTSLKSVSLPNATKIGDNGFMGCTNLENVYAPNVTSIGSSAFSACSNLQTANFLAYSVPSYAFSGCRKLSSIYLPRASTILSSAFTNCNSLTKLIIATQLTIVINLSSTNAFNNCYHILGTVNATYNPNGLKDGFIYVKASLVAQYRIATNWITYASQIMPWVATIDELASIDGTLYDHACVGETEYVYNGVGWVEFIRGEV